MAKIEVELNAADPIFTFSGVIGRSGVDYGAKSVYFNIKSEKESASTKVYLSADETVTLVEALTGFARTLREYNKNVKKQVGDKYYVIDYWNDNERLAGPFNNLNDAEEARLGLYRLAMNPDVVYVIQKEAFIF